MSDKWSKVSDRVEEEIDTINNNLKKLPIRVIEDFYPELKKKNNNRNWSSTGGLPVIASAMTSPQTLVDIYDWDSEEQLIAHHGINLKFLLRLRDSGHVTLLPNLPPERFRRESCSWLYDILSHKDTVWRSLRTPAFFDAICDDRDNQREKMQGRLEKFFKKLGDTRILKLCKLVKISYPPNSSESLAQLLSTWYSYVYPNNKTVADKTWEDLQKTPEEVIPEIRQLYLMYAPTQTAALGGNLRLMEDKLLSYFPKELPTEQLSEKAEIRALHEFLTKIQFDFTQEDLNNVKYWNSLSQTKQTDILNFLQNDKERGELLTTERNLRALLYKKRDFRNTLNGIETYVQRLDDHYDRLSSFGSQVLGISKIALFTNFFFNEGDKFSTELLIYLNIPDALPFIDKALRRIPSKVLEATIPQLQVVKFVRHRKGRC